MVLRSIPAARAALQDGVKPVIAGEDGTLAEVDAAHAVQSIDAIAGGDLDARTTDEEGAPSKS